METFPENKLNAIRGYLRVEFPDRDLADRYELDRLTQTFRLDDGKRICLVTIAREFIDDHKPDEISRLLNGLQLNNYFNVAKVSRVIIKNKGVETE
jgi:hypothetical protein